MKNIIVGTAGHVDHGKTRLIKALTGIDTDRLKEEKERGMTIDLGFASLELPNGQKVGIVDVPGHERFLKNMLAGAGGVDVALMVIAADESVMPQTVEHLEILQLLDVGKGVVALTKADLVDEDWLEAVKDDVRAALAGSFLDGSPIISVSSTAGTGLVELLAALQDACDEVDARNSAGPFRLPVDRVFTLTGFGTVVTGTLVSGTVKVGDAVEILPSGLRSRVRQIQVHGSRLESAQAGSRVAVNLVGVEVSDLERGDVCASPGTLTPANLLDVKLTLLKDAPRALRNRTRVRFHIGTAELLGRMTLLGRDELRPGEQTYAQFKSESPAAALRGDRFVIRSYSPMVTIGGGTIVDPKARKHKRFDTAAISALDMTSRGTPEELMEQALKGAPAGAAAAAFVGAAGLNKADVQGILDSLRRSGRAVELDAGRFIHSSTFDGYAAAVRRELTRFHENNPLKPGMSKEELRNTAVRGLDSRGFAALLAELERAGRIATSGAFVSLPEHQATFTSEQQAAADGISAKLHRAGFNAPSADELLRETGLSPGAARDVLDLLAHRGEIVKIADGLYYHKAVVEKAERMLREYLEKHGKITVGQFRDLIDSSRKYVVPLLEYFDSKKVTRRVGDERVAGSGGEAKP